MTRRGPIPGTTGRPSAEVAALARYAHHTGQRMEVRPAPPRIPWEQWRRTVEGRP